MIFNPKPGLVSFSKIRQAERCIVPLVLSINIFCILLYTNISKFMKYKKKKPVKPMMYTDIAADHEYSAANKAHNKCEKALEKLRKAIKELI